MSDPAAAPSPWQEPSFRPYWLARLCTAAGFQMQAVVVGWHVYPLTGAALDLGLVGPCSPLVVAAVSRAHRRVRPREDAAGLGRR
jgi:hypothetical protein